MKENNKKVLKAMRWGLIPSYSNEGTNIGYKTINARIETVNDKPMYKRLVNSKRCVVIMDGYYEWQTLKNNKNNVYIFHYVCILEQFN